MNPTELRSGDTLDGKVARIGKALSSRRRLELLDTLRDGSYSIYTLTRQAGISRSVASQHLWVLSCAGLVVTRRERGCVLYQIAGEHVSQALQMLTAVAGGGPPQVCQDIRGHTETHEDEPLKDGESLLDRIREGTLAVVDVRPAEEYRAGHIPGAVSVPVEELSRREGELPKKGEVMVFCREPYCTFAAQAISFLSREGLSAIRTQDGIEDWQSHGLPVSTGDMP